MDAAAVGSSSSQESRFSDESNLGLKFRTKATTRAISKSEEERTFSTQSSAPHSAICGRKRTRGSSCKKITGLAGGTRNRGSDDCGGEDSDANDYHCRSGNIRVSDDSALDEKVEVSVRPEGKGQRNCVDEESTTSRRQSQRNHSHKGDAIKGNSSLTSTTPVSRRPTGGVRPNLSMHAADVAASGGVLACIGEPTGTEQANRGFFTPSYLCGGKEAAVARGADFGRDRGGDRRKTKESEKVPELRPASSKTTFNLGAPPRVNSQRASLKKKPNTRLRSNSVARGTEEGAADSWTGEWEGVRSDDRHAGCGRFAPASSRGMTNVRFDGGSIVPIRSRKGGAASAVIALETAEEEKDICSTTRRRCDGSGWDGSCSNDSRSGCERSSSSSSALPVVLELMSEDNVVVVDSPGYDAVTTPEKTANSSLHGGGCDGDRGLQGESSSSEGDTETPMTESTCARTRAKKAKKLDVSDRSGGSEDASTKSRQLEEVCADTKEETHEKRIKAAPTSRFSTPPTSSNNRSSEEDAGDDSVHILTQTTKVVSHGQASKVVGLKGRPKEVQTGTSRKGKPIGTPGFSLLQSNNHYDDMGSSASGPVSMSPSDATHRKIASPDARKQKNYERRPNGVTMKQSGQKPVCENLNDESKRKSRSTERKQYTEKRSRSEQLQSDEVIQIGDTSDSDNGSCVDEREENLRMEKHKLNKKGEQMNLALRRPRHRSFGDRYRCEAVRIAVGAKVFSSGCILQFQPGAKGPFLFLDFVAKDIVEDGFEPSPSKTREKTRRHKITIDDSIIEMKYYIADEGETDDNIIRSTCSDCLSSDDMSFLSLKVMPTKNNGLAKYSDHYSPNEAGTSKQELAKQYIVIEVRSNEEFEDMLRKMRSNYCLEAFLSDSSQLQSKNNSCYCAALIEDSRREKEKRMRSLGSPSKDTTSRELSRLGSGFDSFSDNKTLLVFPFAVKDDRVFDVASCSLHEASGKLVKFNENQEPEWYSPSDRPVSSEVKVSNRNSDMAIQASTGRTHYLTIRKGDLERLRPGEFLNDTIVDFWMKWIWRHDDPNTSSVHFFSSHFFTTLSAEGPEAVSSWTAKKNVDIFDKKFIFIPINASLHWSLCVVVNPGFISNAFVSSRESPYDMPCILFFDSLKAHRKGRVAANVRKWLNFEAKRLRKFGELKEPPFDSSSMLVFDPKVPYQDNSWDCGVFVCRYAYSLLSLRHEKITYNGVTPGKRAIENVITGAAAFSFNMKDITRLRLEILKLLMNLADEYLHSKRIEAEEKRKQKEHRIQSWTEREKAESGSTGIDGFEA